jgi:hypothetical protein
MSEETRPAPPPQPREPAPVDVDYNRAPWWNEAPVHVDPAADYDLLWRKQPVRLGFIQFARQLPPLAGLLARKVPGAAWMQVADGVVEVACPCGSTPRCEWNVPKPCECERIVLYFAGDVRVAYIPEEERE